MKSEKKKLMVLGAGLYQLPAIEAGRDLGAFVIAVDGSEDAPGLAKADERYVLDISDPEACLELARRLEIDAVVSICTEVGVPPAARIAEELGLPGISTGAALAATDKWVMRNRFAEAGIAGPQFRLAIDEQEALAAARDIGFPVVVKPVDSAGSRGISRVESEVGLPEAFHLAHSRSRKQKVIIEEFMKGTEVTVESLTYNGRTSVLAISDKKHVPFPNCVAICLTYPPFFSGAIQQEIRSMVERAVLSLGIDCGATHAELMVTGDGPKFVEIAARGGGFRVFSDMIPLVSGVDAVRETVKMALGIEPDIEPRFQKGAVLRFFNPSRRGELVEVRGVEDARRMDGITDIVIDVRPGDLLKDITGDGERPGFLIATGDTREEAVGRADRAEALVEFVVRSKSE
ncbi:MAG: ATP-grasp domain-containing protein [Verrucomicrobia bacterium]|nr:ATP-grasp domain-containing protein [Verrucomicrobiota bacterium]